MDVTSEVRPKVLFVYPVEKGFPFWDSQVDYASAVSEALGFELEVAYAPKEYRNRFAALSFIKERVASSKKKPNLLITSFWLGSEFDILTYLEEQKIYGISINSDISQEQYARLGRPREQFTYWLASLSPNDTLAGKQLAEAILSHVKTKNCPLVSCEINVFAITGLRYSAVSIQRATGLHEALANEPQSKLLNLVYGKWDRQVVRGMTEAIIQRHDKIDAFWVASDVMAYGIFDRLNELGIELDPATVVGGIDWSPYSVELIENGTMTMSLGGHFLEGGWAITLFFDYLNGRDFEQETGSVIKTSMSLLNANNVKEVGQFLSNPQWSPEQLRAYSKFLNPKRVKYNMDPQLIISDQINALKNAKLNWGHEPQ
ncbi:ABC transporter substrate-binding protein [Agaribacter flavus]|uniref:ABC transporter substrate-binding protein n=1 Tax=Agaribacter flavus TaxID=1902781 RepID=A0ABV7FTM3_9ALTE